MKINLRYPEDVLVEIAQSFGGWHVENASVLRHDRDICGAASYEVAEGDLEITVLGMFKVAPGEGWCVVEGVTADYYRGDGYQTDDDMVFYHKNVRAATVEEIARHYDGTFWDAE